MTRPLLSTSAHHWNVSECGAGHEVWKLIYDLVHNLSEVILQTLPSFWKVAKGYMEGKYQKVCHQAIYDPVGYRSDLEGTCRKMRSHRLAVGEAPLNAV